MLYDDLLYKVINNSLQVLVVREHVIGAARTHFVLIESEA